MKTHLISLVALAGALLPARGADAQQVDRAGRPVMDVAVQLQNGEFVWAPELSPPGTALLIVNLANQRAVLFRNGLPIAASSVSTGKPGHDTPTGVFTILEKKKEHYSSTYNNAPMPNMQRLTWKGVALHAGKLPGYPASHGCIRLPPKFSELLFTATKLGMTVVITSVPVVPRDSGVPDLAQARHAAQAAPLTNAAYRWNPDRAPHGLVSVIVSAGDQRAMVFRGGKEIGSAPVRVSGPIGGGMAYVLKAWDSAGPHWMKVQFSGSSGGVEGADEVRGRFDAPSGFRQAVAQSLRPGSVIIVVPESLSAGSPGREQTVIADEPSGS